MSCAVMPDRVRSVGLARDREERGERDDARDPGKARAPEDERKRREQVGDQAARAVARVRRVEQRLHDGAEPEREGERDRAVGAGEDPAHVRDEIVEGHVHEAYCRPGAPAARRPGPRHSPSLPRVTRPMPVTATGVVKDGSGARCAERPAPRTFRVMDATIEAHGLSKRYGSTLAVDDLTFTVQPGPGDRLRRAERRGQVDHDADDPRPRCAGQRHGARQRPALRVARRSAAGGRGAARRASIPSCTPGARPSPLARGEQRASARACRRGAGACRPHESRPPEGRRLLAGNGASGSASRPRSWATRPSFSSTSP